jgi:methylmalonyl-CoA epimerase
MKVLGIDHVGIAVRKIEGSKSFWGDALGLPLAGCEAVAEQKVTTAHFPIGASAVELLESTEPDGPLGRFLARRGEGVQHVALRVQDLDGALVELRAKGVRLIDQEPRRGAGGARIAFIHPESTHGVLVELCER